MSFSARLSLVHFVAWNPTSTEFQPQLLTSLGYAMGAVYMCGALFALDLILLYHFVSTFIVPLPIFARPFDLLHGFLFPSLPAFSTSMFLPFLPFCLVPILVPSLLLLPLSSPSNLISLRPFILLLLCPPTLYPISPFSCLPSLDTILVQAGPPHFHLVSLP